MRTIDEIKIGETFCTIQSIRAIGKFHRWKLLHIVCNMHTRNRLLRLCSGLPQWADLSQEHRCWSSVCWRQRAKSCQESKNERVPWDLNRRRIQMMSLGQRDYWMLYGEVCSSTRQQLAVLWCSHAMLCMNKLATLTWDTMVTANGYISGSQTRKNLTAFLFFNDRQGGRWMFLHCQIWPVDRGRDEAFECIAMVGFSGSHITYLCCSLLEGLGF